MTDRADGSAGETPLSRRRFLGAATGSVLAGPALVGRPAIGGRSVSAGHAAVGRAGSPTGSDQSAGSAAGTQADLPNAVGAELVAAGFTAPVGIAFPPGGDGRGYVVDQAGRIFAVGLDGAGSDVEPEPFLDLTDRMVDLGGGYDERGLLGLAFHPAFAENGRFFVRYSAPRRSGTPAEFSHTFVLSEFAAGGDPPTADPDSERAILEIPQPQSNHNAGDLAFGPDGFLHVGVGDGGAANDRGAGHVDDWYDAVGGGNGQDVAENLLGSVLRIDVDGQEDGWPYAIPDDNPLVGREGLDEQYAWGLRNPWRLSFDGDRLLVADVGQNRYEEVNLVEKGGNYGWNVREGAHCFDADDCPTNAPAGPTYGGQPLRDPIVAYPHSGDGPTGIAVIGGYVARDEALPGLAGRYVFADWRADGRLFVATPPGGGGGDGEGGGGDGGGGQWPVEVVSTSAVGDHPPGSMVLGFGRDPDGAVYVCSTDRNGLDGDTGAVHRLVPADGAGDGGGEDTPADDGTGATDGESEATTTTGADATASDGQPGFGALAALLGVGGAVGYLLARVGR